MGKQEADDRRSKIKINDAVEDAVNQIKDAATPKLNEQQALEIIQVVNYHHSAISGITAAVSLIMIKLGITHEQVQEYINQQDTNKDKFAGVVGESDITGPPTGDLGRQ